MPYINTKNQNYLKTVLPKYRSVFSFFMFEFPCIISLYYIKNQQDATLAVLFIRVILQLLINITAKVASCWFFI